MWKMTHLHVCSFALSLFFHIVHFVLSLSACQWTKESSEISADDALNPWSFIFFLFQILLTIYGASCLSEDVSLFPLSFSTLFLLRQLPDWCILWSTWNWFETSSLKLLLLCYYKKKKKTGLNWEHIRADFVRCIHQRAKLLYVISSYLLVYVH